MARANGRMEHNDSWEDRGKFDFVWHEDHTDNAVSFALPPSQALRGPIWLAATQLQPPDLVHLQWLPSSSAVRDFAGASLPLVLLVLHLFPWRRTEKSSPDVT